MELMALERLAEASTTLEGLRSVPSDDDKVRAAIRFRLGVLRSAQGRHDEALPLLRDAVAFYAGRSKRWHANALHCLGQALFRSGAVAQALDALSEVRAMLGSVQPNGSPDLADIDVSLSQAQLALGQTADAVASSGAAVTFWTRFEPAHRCTALSLLWHARALIAADQVSEASTAWRRAAMIVESVGLQADRAFLAQTARLLRSDPARFG
jgi:tetratricopeptide (TPR) repeat protein